MRDYASISPQFWIGKTGKSLRGNMPAQVLAMYLMTCPHANMIGVYHCPIIYMAHETGMTFEGASKALASLIEAGFCHFEEASETVFVTRMAAFQVGDQLKPTDNKVIGIKKEFEKIAEPRIKSMFFEVYGDAYYLNFNDQKDQKTEPLPSPSEAPPKQLTRTGSGTGTGLGKNSELADFSQTTAENQNPEKQKPTKRAIAMPDDFSPNETGLAYAEKLNVNMAIELQSFQNWHRAKGSTFKDWQAAWRTWCDKAASFGRTASAQTMPSLLVGGI